MQNKSTRNTVLSVCFGFLVTYGAMLTMCGGPSGSINGMQNNITLFKAEVNTSDKGEVDKAGQKGATEVEGTKDTHDYSDIEKRYEQKRAVDPNLQD